MSFFKFVPFKMLSKVSKVATFKIKNLHQVEYNSEAKRKKMDYM